MLGGTARWACAAGQGTGAARTGGTACRRDGQGLGRAGRARGTQAFVPWARAGPLQAPLKELSCQGLHFASASALPEQAGRACRLVPFVLAAPPIPLPHKQPRATREGQALLCQAWAQALAFLLPPPSPGLAQHCSSLLTAFGSCNPGSRICSQQCLGSLWQSLPSVGPGMLQGTWRFASDSLSSLFKRLSVPQNPGLSLKSTIGINKIQKAFGGSWFSFIYLHSSSRACAAAWSQLGVLSKKEISKCTL